MNNTTRISDLPENIMMQVNKTDDLTESVPATNYIPINVHPNPYGISAQNPIMPPMQQQQPNEQQMQQMQKLEKLSEQQKRELLDMRQVNLPSKHVNIDTAAYMQDEAVQANYIPSPKLTKDYILEYEDEFEKKKKENEKKKYQTNRVEQILTEFQLPFLIALLFLIFQLPIVNTMVFKRFSFLSIYHEDGNFNFYGLVFKSVMFGGLFYSVQKMIDFVNEI